MSWIARLGDGRELREDSVELQGGPRSPWRQLEALAREAETAIVWVRAEHGTRAVDLDAEGCPLVCGQTVESHRDLASGVERIVHYWWVVRQGQDAWIWRLTDGARVWEIETSPGTPGREAMPSPPEGT